MTEGTQVQFWSGDPNDPYSSYPDAYLQVEGSLVTQGSVEEPVELFPSFRWATAGAGTHITNMATTELHYTEIRNPQVGTITSIDHSYFDYDSGEWGIYARSMTDTILHKLPNDPDYPYGFGPGDMDTVLVDSLHKPFNDRWESNVKGNIPSVVNTVFLQGARGRPLGWELTDEFGSSSDAVTLGPHRDNAFLSRYWHPDTSQWMRFSPAIEASREAYFGLAGNFWGTTSTNLIDAAILDGNDDFNRARIVYQPILSSPAATTYPFVVDIVLTTSTKSDATIVGARTSYVHGDVQSGYGRHRPTRCLLRP